MIFGYARVSTTEQSLDWQIRELTANGAKEILQGKKLSIMEICGMFDISKPTLYKEVRDAVDTFVSE